MFSRMKITQSTGNYSDNNEKLKKELVEADTVLIGAGAVGKQTFLTDGVARLADGTIAGAASNLYEDLKTAIRFGSPEDTAIRAATIIPAKEAGADAQAGSIEVGKWADFLVCDEAWNLKMVCIEGSRIA